MKRQLLIIAAGIALAGCARNDTGPATAGTDSTPRNSNYSSSSNVNEAAGAARSDSSLSTTNSSQQSGASDASSINRSTPGSAPGASGPSSDSTTK
jgi:hypothetical protein